MKTAAQSVPSAVIRIAPPIRTLLARAISSTANSAMLRELPVTIAPTASHPLPGTKAPIPQSDRPKAEPISLSEARVSKVVSSSKDGDGFGFGGDTEYQTWLRDHGHLEELGMVTKLVPDGMATTRANIRKHRTELKRYHSNARRLSASQHKKQMGSGKPRKVHANSGLPECMMSIRALSNSPSLDWYDSELVGTESSAVISNPVAIQGHYKLGLLNGVHHKEVKRIISQQTRLYEARMQAKAHLPYEYVRFVMLSGGNEYVYPNRRKEMFHALREQRKERQAAKLAAEMREMSKPSLRRYMGPELGWIDRHGWVNKEHPDYGHPNNTYNPGIMSSGMSKASEDVVEAIPQVSQLPKYEAGITAFEQHWTGSTSARTAELTAEDLKVKDDVEYERMLQAIAQLEGECPPWLSLLEYATSMYNSVDECIYDGPGLLDVSKVETAGMLDPHYTPEVVYEWDDEYAYHMYQRQRERTAMTYSNDHMVCDQDVLDQWYEHHCTLDDWFAVTERSTGDVVDWVDMVYTPEDYRIAATAAMLARRVVLDLAPPPEGHVMTGSGIWVPLTIRQQLEASLHNEGYKETLILHGNEMFDELRDIKNGVIAGTDRTVSELERSLREIRDNMNEMERVEKSTMYSIPKGVVKFNPKRTVVQKVKRSIKKKAKHLWSAVELKASLLMHRLAAVV